MGTQNDNVTQMVAELAGTLVLWLGFRLVVDQLLVQLPPPVTHYSSRLKPRLDLYSHFKTTNLYSAVKRPIRSLWQEPVSFF